MPLRGRVGRHARQGGRHCRNWPDDQQTVIALLNRIPADAGGAAGRLSKPVIDGLCSDELYRAIVTFEDKHWPGQGSGYVDPGGAMLKRLEELAAAKPATPTGPAAPAGSIDFVMPDQPWVAPTGSTKAHSISGKQVALETHMAMYVGIVGDRGNVVQTIAADPNNLTIEDAGMAGGTRWFRLSRPRGDKLTVKAKDATGGVLASFTMSVVQVPRGPGRLDLDVDPKNPGTINVRVYNPTDDADWIDKRMEAIGYNIYLGGFQVYVTGMTTPIDVPNSLVDLTLNEAEAIDSTVYDTLAQANEAIKKAPASAKGLKHYAFYRGAGGAVIAPTVFSPATSPRIIATYYEARTLYADYVINALSGIAIGIVGGIVLRTILGRIFRKLSEDPKPPRQPPPVPTPAKIKPVNGSVNVGGGGEIPDVTNLNPIKPGSGGPSRGIPNHVPAPMEKMDEIFVPGSVQNMYSQRLRYQDVDWPVATRAAAKVMPKGGKVQMNVWTRDKQQLDALTAEFEKAGFEVTSKGGTFHRPGPGTMIEATRL